MKDYVPVAERKEAISLQMQYGVPEDRKDEAFDLLDHYGADLIALNIFQSFYSFLPEAQDDVITALRLLARRQGGFLIMAQTLADNYLYLATHGQADLIGRAEEGLADSEILEFFGFEDNDDFLNKIQDPDSLQVYDPAYQDKDICTVCFVADGEFHTLGCPVEICPWCGGQLTYCNCRFEQLGIDELEDDAQLELLLERLEEAGRVPFSSEQRPGYPTMDDDDDDLPTGEEF
jgi:hypothetical protein